MKQTTHDKCDNCMYLEECEQIPSKNGNCFFGKPVISPEKTLSKWGRDLEIFQQGRLSALKDVEKIIDKCDFKDCIEVFDGDMIGTDDKAVKEILKQSLAKLEKDGN